MSKLFERTYDHTKEHKELDHDDTHIFCPHCGKTVEDRPMPDYGVFMGAVWIKQNLPCKPYEATPTPPTGIENGKAQLGTDNA